MARSEIDRASAATGGKAFHLDSADPAILWFDLPGDKVNKFSSSVMLELDEILNELSKRREILRLVIASGKPGIFIAGADITEFTKVTSASQAEEFIRFGQNVFSKLAALPQITIAAINGACMGGGTELALNCDYRIMSDHPKSVIALPEVRLGIIPAWSGTTRLPRLIGIPAALDMILTGKTLDARRAKRSGLVDEVVAAPILIDAAKAYVARQSSKRTSRNDKTHFYIEGNPLARRVIFGKARKSVLDTTKGQYPAPLKAIDVMEAGFSSGIEGGLAAEARAASELIMGPVAQNLVRLFFMMEDAKKDRGAPRTLDAAGILGAGLMGAGIAHAIADKTELDVRMKDVNWNALSAGMKSIAKIWKKTVDRGRMSRAEMARKLSRITPTTDWSGFSRSDILVEAVLEKLEVKQEVLREFESIAKHDAIFATNTSTIPITNIAEGAARPENVIGMHFFSPVDKMPLVEVIVGRKTSSETLATVAAFGRKLGKTVVVCEDGPGFIVNRLLGPYMNEAGLLLEEGNSIESIDGAMVKFGMPLGPLALLDEVGIDVAGKASEVMRAAFGHRMRASVLIEKLLSDQRFGKKNGRGMYRWDGGKRGPADPGVYGLLGVSSPRAGDEMAMVERMMLAMINEASVVVDERIAHSSDDVDLAMILGTGFPPFRGGPLHYADSLGATHLVERLEQLRSKGPHFVPSEAIRRLDREHRTFAEVYP